MTRPIVRLSFAQTLDGRMATLDGSSQWISGPEALQYAHIQRARHDAIMVGAGTIIADDPRLTVRLVEGRDPLRIVVDSSLRTPLTARVLVEGAASGTILAVTQRAAPKRITAAQELGATVWVLPEAGGRVDLAALLAALHARSIGSLMVEGGPTLMTALLRARLADTVAVCVAPKILGSGRDAVGDLGICSLAQAVQLRGVSWQRLGVDLIVEGELEYA